MKLKPKTEPIAKFAGEYRFLSNFYPAEIELYGCVFPSVEHAYQAMKMKTATGAYDVLKAPTAAEAKKAGQGAMMRSDWDNIKVDAMKFLLYLKFRNDGLRKMLVDTGDAELIEGNNWGDCFWGVCKGRGTNYLGRLLMKLRQEINEGDNV